MWGLRYRRIIISDEVPGRYVWYRYPTLFEDSDTETDDDELKLFYNSGFFCVMMYDMIGSISTYYLYDSMMNVNQLSVVSKFSIGNRCHK